MKKFDQFINEEYDKNDDYKRRLAVRKEVKAFIQEFVVDKLEEDVKIIKVKPWSDDTEIVLRFQGNFFSVKTSPKSFKNRLNKSLKQVDEIEKILNVLNIEFNIKQLANSADIEIDMNLSTDYFETNKDILNSLKGIKKYSL